MTNDNDFKKNFGMIIPTKPTIIPEMVEDPLGAPIYKGCQGKGPCACTGACREVIGHSTDPKDVSEYRSYISNYNAFQKSLHNGLMQRVYSEKAPDGSYTWEFKNNQP